MTTDQKHWFSRYMLDRTDRETGEPIIDLFGVERGAFEGPTTEQKFKTEKAAIIEELSEIGAKNLYNSAADLVSQMNEWLDRFGENVKFEEENYTNVRFKEEPEEWFGNEATLVGTNPKGNEVVIGNFDDIDHNNPKEIREVMRKLKFSKPTETRLGAGRKVSGGPAAIHGNTGGAY